MVRVELVEHTVLQADVPDQGRLELVGHDALMGRVRRSDGERLVLDLHRVLPRDGVWTQAVPGSRIILEASQIREIRAGVDGRSTFHRVGTVLGSLGVAMAVFFRLLWP